MVWNTEEYLKYREHLKEGGSEKLAAFFKKLVPGSEHVIGLNTQKIKEEIKYILSTDISSYIRVAKPLYHEEIGLLGQVMANSKASGEELIEYILRYQAYNTNWATNDSFAASLKVISKNLDFYFPFIKELSKSDKPYDVRLALILLMNYYLTDKYIDKVLKISDSIKTEHYYVMMGNAWLIATALAKQYEKTEKFLHTTILDRVTVNKAIQKAVESRRVTGAQKEHLKKFKRK